MVDITILGISAYYHDSSAAVIRNGEIVAAAQEERFTRKKGDNSFPTNAIDFCLQKAKKAIAEIDYIVFYEDTVLKFERILTSMHFSVPGNFKQYINAIPSWVSDKLRTERKIQKELGTKKKIMFCQHHISHAASAFLPSPFKSAAILTVDGVGEWATSTFGVGNDNSIHLHRELRYPNSLGILYSAFTYYCGFKINSGEYKLMGLAPYGEPIYADLIKKELVNIFDDGSFVINQKYFSYTKEMCTINKKFENLFGSPARTPESNLDKIHLDVAASIQSVTTEILIKMATALKSETGESNLVMAGGVALNVTATGELLRRNIFDNIWIQPASGDAGGSVGAALYYYYCVLGNERITDEKNDLMNSMFLGPDVFELKYNVSKMQGKYTALNDGECPKIIAQLLSKGKIVAVANGRMEFGPRALGCRSILCDARDPSAQKKLNLKIKFREDFRPFAPIVLEEDAKDYFEINGESPYMLFSYYVNKSKRLPFQKTDDVYNTVNTVRSDITAVTHIDYSARVQTVTAKNNLLLYNILRNFKEITGCSVLVNTSFNVRGEPIVNSCVDAYECFMNTDIDYVLIGNRLYDKTQQKKSDSKRSVILD